MKERQRAGLKKRNLLCDATAVVLSALVFLPSANAALLHGYVSQQTGSPEAQQKFLSSATSSNVEMQARSDSFPQEMQGSWQCVSVVTDSLVDSVLVGQKIVSRMNFVRTNDGRVIARFVQPGWTEAQESVKALAANRYQMDKTNYFYGDTSGGAWAARSRDNYLVLEKNRMIAESEVDQYVNGCYMGRYRTRSTLVRINTGIENVALFDAPDPDDQSGDNLNPFMK